MVPQHSSGPPPRDLSPDVLRQLEHAFGQFAARAADAAALLTEAVRAVGRDARARALTPEELVLAFKSVEARVQLSAPKDWTATALRTGLIRAMLEAYYES